MTSRYSKFGAVAATVVFAAIATLFLSRSTPAYAITDLATAFDQVRVIHIKGRYYFPGRRASDGAERAPIETDNWIDVGNHRVRYAQVGDAGIMETVCNGPYAMMVLHPNKMVGYSRVSELNRELMTYRLSRLAVIQLYGGPEQLAGFVKVGQESMSGTTYDVWQLDTAHVPAAGLSSASLRFKLWLTADRGRLVRSQVWSHNRDGQWQLRNDFDTIEYNVEPPAGTFTLEPPPGYTAANSKETAPPMGLMEGGSASSGAAECGTFVSFTLADGSVVLGWRSSDRSTKESQEPLFANRVFGGPLPELPVEIYGLIPFGGGNGTTYIGYHLAWTRKADRLIEWGLYVPDGVPPASVRSLGYRTLCRYHLGPKFMGAVSLNPEYGLPVGNAADFQKYVLGAIAELSDSGTPPSDVTWQKVVDLARQKRNH